MLQYIYTGKLVLKDSELDRMFDFMSIAKTLELTNLMEDISILLKNCLNRENVVLIYENGFRCGQKNLKESCEHLIDQHAEYLVAQKSLTKMSSKCLQEILGRDSFGINEMRIFELVNEWHVYHNQTKNLNNELIKKIRFELFSNKELFNLTHHSNLVDKNLLFKILNDRIFHENTKMLTRHFQSTESTKISHTSSTTTTTKSISNNNLSNKLKSKEDYVIDYFERVEADILLEKEANVQKLDTYYQKLVDEVQMRKNKCLQNIKTKNIPDNELEAIKQTLVEHESALKKKNQDFILRTLDGDQIRWNEIQLECDTLLKRIKSLGEELNERIIGDQMIRFIPSSNNTRIVMACGLLSVPKFDSKIINEDKKHNDLVELCRLSAKQFKLLYRASRDGFQTSNFHAKCDNQPRTLTIIKTTEGYIFGGYTEVAWDSTNNWKVDPNALIFSLVNVRSTPLLIPVKVGNKHSIYCHASYGPTFGGGHEIYISNNSNTANTSYSNFGHSYDLKLFSYDSTEAKSFLAGSYNFQTSEIEVFQLN